MEATHSKSSSILNIAANLAAACFVAGIIIAGVFFYTSPIAAEKSVELKNSSMKSLVKEADEFKQIEGKTEWFEAKKSGKLLAYIVPSEAKGYGGKIKLLVAISPDNKVIGYDIIAHNETPGLGDGTGKEFFKERIIGKTAEHLKVIKEPSNKEDVQAITGATISSRAVTEGVRQAAEEVASLTGGNK